MIQDIYPHKFDNQFRAEQTASGDDMVVVFSEGDRVLCRVTQESFLFPTAEDCRSKQGLIYLFALDDRRFFLGTQEDLKRTDGYEYVSIKKLRKKDAAHRHLIFAAVTAYHLQHWYRMNRFCGCCGKPLQHARKERAMVCPACGAVFYPRINPAVIVGVTDGDNLLLTKYANRGMNFYALVAGFTEIGETFEETVRREVMEETGLTVGNIRYYKSQPWGFAQDILAGYYCDVIGDPQIRMDTGELKEAVWMPRDQVPGQPDDFSLTNEMMVSFREGRV